MEDRNNTHFTPGPWRVSIDRNNSGVVAPVGDGRMPVANTGSFWFGVEQSEANARLISAAPEMYEWQEEVLEILRRLCRSLNTDDYIRERLEPVIYRGEQIGKKARGEA